jgi:hypothetical protein
MNLKYLIICSKNEIILLNKNCQFFWKLGQLLSVDYHVVLNDF